MKQWHLKVFAFQAVKDNAEAGGEVSDNDSEPEGEELLKDVRERRKSIKAAATAITAQEQALLRRLHSQPPQPPTENNIQHNNVKPNTAQEIPNNK